MPPKFDKKSAPTQLHLSLTPEEPSTSLKKAQSHRNNSRMNKLDPQDRAFHDWYRFVLSFPPHLVRNYINAFEIGEQHTVLDPFCGTGTTLVETKLHGIRAIGLEANSSAHFASSVKVDWEMDPDLLARNARHLAKSVRSTLEKQGMDDNRPFGGNIEELPLKTLDSDVAKLLITNSISPLPLHKTLVLLDCLKRHQKEKFFQYGLLALANALVFTIGNLHFGPEVGAGKPKDDIPVIAAWLSNIEKIAGDLRLVAGKSYPVSEVHMADAREISHVIQPNSVDAVITSPPYPNEKDYTRTTRLESVVLGFMKSKAELREQKKKLIRSNTRGVYKDDDDHTWIAGHPKIQHIAESIEKRRIELGKNSGFEKLYGRVTRLYFGGMARHLASLREVLRPGARLAYVVGDQASYLRVMIRTGQLLGDIAEVLGYELVRIDPFRTRFATATREELREEVVVLRWTGKKR